MVKKYRSGLRYPIHVQKLLHGSADCKIFCENNFCMDFMRICGKSGLAYEMCEHLKMVDGLNTYFPEHVLLNETMLETLGEDNGTGLKCLKEETIVKCKQLNNLSKASGKIPVAAFDNDEYIHISVFTSKVHYSARLKRFIVTYHKFEKTLDCQCCSRKITCIHKGMAIWYLTPCNMIIGNPLHEFSEETEHSVSVSS